MTWGQNLLPVGMGTLGSQALHSPARGQQEFTWPSEAQEAQPQGVYAWEGKQQSLRAHSSILRAFPSHPAEKQGLEQMAGSPLPGRIRRESPRPSFLARPHSNALS